MPWAHSPTVRSRIAAWHRAQGSTPTLHGRTEPVASVGGSVGVVEIGRLTTPAGCSFATIATDGGPPRVALGDGAITHVIRALARLKAEIEAQRRGVG